MISEGNFYIGIILSIIIMFLMLYDCLLILQQNHYHYSYVKKYYCKTEYEIEMVVVFLSLLRFIKFEGLLILFDYLILVFYVIYIFYWFNKKRILKLKFTKRIIRIAVLMVIISMILVMLFDYLIIIALTPINVFISMVLLEPIEKLINRYYVRRAKEKIDRIKPVVIGITGSAGKTSVKNFIYQLFKNEKITFMTPKSYNTVMGLCKAINEELNDKTEVAILEYGASKKGDIDELLKVVVPDIAIITNVLPQHLETFKSVENIMEEKFKLLKAGKVAILNTDIIDTILPENVLKITASSKKDADYIIKNVKIDEKGCSFNLNGIDFSSKLLGKCNYENIILAVMVALYFNLSPNNLVYNVKNLECVSDRLEIFEESVNGRNVTIINDSFNSNIKGFKNALEVVGYYKSDKKAIITPGIVEGGKKEEELNGIITKEIVKCNINIYIVKSKVSKYIASELNKLDYNYLEFDSFLEAYNLALKSNDVVLIENDISDIYK